nr:SUF system Fe-S cluster assembly regulator [Oceanococcus sp. HetDA_MAG_MS8]
MLRVAKLTDYALVLLTHLAECEQSAVSAQALAERSQLHLPMASKALKRLAQAGVIVSTRGSQGGYSLAKPAAATRVLDVVECMEGPLGIAPCTSADHDCELLSHCGLRPHWAVINHRIRAELARLSIADLCRPPIPSLLELS